MSRNKAFRALLAGLWGGYAAFSLAFSYHIRYADYYHLQLVPIIAFSIAPLARLVLNHVKQLSIQWYWFLPAFGALLVMGMFTYREIRGTLTSYTAIESEEIAKEIGDTVNHSNKTVYIASYYGRPLEYYGELSGAYWPRSVSDTDRVLGRSYPGLTVEQRIRAFGFSPEYYIITQFDEFSEHHTDLKEYLIRYCSPVAESQHYLIYGTCAEPF